MMSDPYTQYLIGSAALPESPMNSALSIRHFVHISVTPFSPDCFLTFFWFSGSYVLINTEPFFVKNSFHAQNGAPVVPQNQHFFISYLVIPRQTLGHRW